MKVVAKYREGDSSVSQQVAEFVASRPEPKPPAEHCSKKVRGKVLCDVTSQELSQGGVTTWSRVLVARVVIVAI